MEPATRNLIEIFSKNTLTENITNIIESLQALDLSQDSAWERGYSSCIESITNTINLALKHSRL